MRNRAADANEGRPFVSLFFHCFFFCFLFRFFFFLFFFFFSAALFPFFFFSHPQSACPSPVFEAAGEDDAQENGAKEDDRDLGVIS